MAYFLTFLGGAATALIVVYILKGYNDRTTNYNK